jgi:flavin reductase (DIM6/NTAB) family NADH-FMN oxidoreductase RutF
MSKIPWKADLLLAPLPAVLVSCGTPDAPCVLTAAWAGIVNSQPPKTYVSIRPQRHSYAIVRQSREFVINLTTRAMMRQVDLCGVRSGRDVDKFALCGFTPQAIAGIGCPAIAQCPVSLGCRVTDILSLESHDMFLADIVSVSADESLVDANNRLQLSRADLLVYVGGAYHALGERLESSHYTAQKKPDHK